MDIKPIRTEQDYDLACKRIEAIFRKIQMQNLGVSRKDLMDHLRKSSGRVSDILNCRRHLTLADIRTLSKILRIPIDVLSQDYPLEKARSSVSTPSLQSVSHC